MIHLRVSPQTLGVVRASVFAIWLSMIVVDPFQNMAALPVAILEPVGIATLIPAAAWPWIMTTQFLLLFKLVLITLLVLCMLGAGPYRSIAITTVVLLTLQQGLVRSVGYINHKQIAILLITFVLAVFPAADGFAWRRNKPRTAAPQTYAAGLMLSTLVFLLTYTAISAFRIAHSSPEIFLGDTMRVYIATDAYLPHSYYGLNFGELVLQYEPLIQFINVGYAVTTLFELLAPLCLFSRPFRYLWLAVIIPFHILTFVMMNILFWQNLLLLPLLLLDTEYWVTRVLSFGRQVRHRLVPRLDGATWRR